MFNLRKIFQIFVFCSIQILFGQQPIFKNYTAKNGLAHDLTYQMIQDKKGNIWIGTDDGLSKFNGSFFKNYSYEDGLTSNYVIDITEGKNDDFYIATWGNGVQKLKNDTITTVGDPNLTYKIGKVFIAKNKVLALRTYTILKVFSILENKDEYKSIRFKNNKIVVEDYKKKNKKDALNIFMNVINDTVYLYSSEVITNDLIQTKGIYTLDLDTYKLTPCYNNYFSNTVIHNLFITKDNVHYVSSFNKIHVIKNNQIENTIEIDLPNYIINNIKKNSNSLYFTGFNAKTQKKELFEYHLYDKTLTNLTKKVSIHALVSDYIIDKDNSIWISTYGQGIYKLPKTKNTFYGNETFESADLRDIIKHNGFTYILSTNNLYRIEKSNTISTVKIPFHTEAFNSNIKNNSLDLITAINGTTIKNNYNLNIRSNNVNSYSVKKSDSIIEFISNRVDIYKNGKLVSSKRIHETENFTRVIKEIGNKIFVIYDRIGVYVFSKKTGDLLEVWDKSTGLISNRINDIEYKDDSFWLASNMGIIEVTPNRNKIIHTTKDGLLSNHINDLYADKYNNLWIASHKGLNIMHNKKFYSIGENEGQKSTFVTKILEDNKFIYVTGNNGLFKYDNTKPYAPSNSSALNISKKNLTFKIENVNFNNPKSVVIQYKVNQNNWRDIDNTILNFENYNYGDYTVMFRSKDGNSEWFYSKKYNFKVKLNIFTEPNSYLFLFIISISILTLKYYKRPKTNNHQNQ